MPSQPSEPTVGHLLRTRTNGFVRMLVYARCTVEITVLANGHERVAAVTPEVDRMRNDY